MKSNEVMDLLEHGGLEYVDRFYVGRGKCTVYIARKK
mgnify:CR=1 FL=1